MSLPPYPNQNREHPQQGFAIPNAPQPGQAAYPAGNCEQPYRPLYPNPEQPTPHGYNQGYNQSQPPAMAVGNAQTFTAQVYPASQALMWKCCCCFDLRTGCIIIAVLQIVGSLVMLGGTSVSDGSSADEAGWGGVVGVAAGICLLVGVTKSNASVILVYLILAMIDIIYQGVVGIVMCAASFGTAALVDVDVGAPVAYILLVFGIWITLMALIDIYFWVCVYRFYQLTKYGIITSCA